MKALLLVLILLAAAALLAIRKLKPGAETSDPPFAANPLNDKTLFSVGWSRDELSTILADFVDRYRDRLPSGFGFVIEPAADAFEVRFPGDIPPVLFGFLVNYTQYPSGLDEEGRSITAFGRTTLSSDFGLPTPELVGQRALFYVPTEDQEYDLVFVRVGGKTYRCSFAARRWKQVSESRMPPRAAAYETSRRLGDLSASRTPGGDR